MKRRPETFEDELKRIWNDIIGLPTFEAHGARVLSKAEVLAAMSDTGIYYITHDLWYDWLRLSNTEQTNILQKAFPYEEYVR